MWLGLTVPWSGAGPAPLSTITVISTLNDVLTGAVSSCGALSLVLRFIDTLKNISVYRKYFLLLVTENISSYGKYFSSFEKKTCDRTPSQSLGKKF